MKEILVKGKTCKSCKQTVKQQEVKFYCDQCKKELKIRGGKKYGCLDATVFYDDDATKRLDFCSWKCCLIKIKEIQCNHFISLPFLLYDCNEKGLRAKDFFNTIEIKED